MAGTAKRTITILNTASLSGKLLLENYRMVGLIVPAAFDGTAITLQGAHPDGDLTGDPPVPADVDFFNVFDRGGSEYTITVAVSRYITLNPDDLVALLWVRLRSGTAVVPVVQTATRTIQVILSTGA